jgi:ribosomal protein uL23
MSNIIRYPLATEKSIRLMESENALIFVVDQNATKTQIKEAVEKLFGAKVDKVRTQNTPDNKKRAYVAFNEETPAIDIATKLGLM